MSILVRDWWVMVVRGLVAISFGLAALIWPGAAFEVLVFLFGAYVLIDGLFAFTAGLWAAGAEQRWWPLVLIGMLGILTGILAFTQRASFGEAMIYVIGAYAAMIGALEIVVAIHLRDLAPGAWLIGLSGLLSAVFGVVIVLNPDAGERSLALLFGIYALVYGLSLIGFGYGLHEFGVDIERPAQMRRAA